MSHVIRIANMFFEIKDNRYFNILNHTERILLKPFLIKSIPKKIKQNKSYIKLRIVYINDTDPKMAPKTSISALKKIRAIFPKKLAKENRDTIEYLFRRSSKLHPAISRIQKIIKPGINIYMILSSKIILIFDRSSKNCVIFIRESLIKNPLPSYRFYFLKFLLRSVLCSENHGILIHASSIGMGKRGYAFTGKSGSGKTTITELMRSKEILSDDMTIIKRIKGRYMLYHSPWQNMNNIPMHRNLMKPYELGALFFIKKARKTVFKRIKYILSLKKIMQEDRLLQRIFTQDKQCISNFYKFASCLLKRTPTFILCVKKDAEFETKFKKFVKHLHIA